MKKIVNGIEVEMTPAEIDARIAEETAWKAERAAREKSPEFIEQKRRMDKDWPTDMEVLEAIFEKLNSNDDTKFNAVKARRDAVIAKHPTPRNN